MPLWVTLAIQIPFNVHQCIFLSTNVRYQSGIMGSLDSVDQEKKIIKSCSSDSKIIGIKLFLMKMVHCTEMIIW